MWARRQAHEIAVHRFDAEHTAGIPTEYAPAFAADGIDETLVAHAPRLESFPVERRHTMQVHASDTGDRWMVTMAPDGITTTREEGPAGVTLTGSAADLYLIVWNRKEDEEAIVDGDADVLSTWHDNVRRRWPRPDPT